MSNIDAELETLLNVLDEIQVQFSPFPQALPNSNPLILHGLLPLPPPTPIPRTHPPHSQQKAVGGKAEKKAKEGGKVDKFMDLKQTMIGTCVCGCRWWWRPWPP